MKQAIYIFFLLFSKTNQEGIDFFLVAQKRKYINSLENEKHELTSDFLEIDRMGG